MTENAQATNYTAAAAVHHKCALPTIKYHP